MTRTAWAVLPLLLLAACDADPDGDGIESSEEKDLGTDPKLADSDGDGLDDGVEVDLGLDPTNADGDDDGLGDGDEVKYGFDPEDPESDGYEGGWPMQEVAVKDALEADGKAGSVVAVGKRFKRLRYKDQNGDEVDLYDFAGQGKKVVIDVAAEWCGPCNFMSDLLAGSYTAADLEGGGFSADEAADTMKMVRAVEDGEIYWVTVLSEDIAGDPAKPALAKSWARTYKNEAVPVLADTSDAMSNYVIASTNGWPTAVLVNESMKVVDIQSAAIAFYEFYRKAFKDGGAAEE